MTFDECSKEIQCLVKSLKQTYDKAYELYYPKANGIIRRLNKGYAVSEFKMDMFLDSILSFGDDDRILSLFKQVCRLSYRLYPQMITEYVELYKNLYLKEV